MKSKRLTVMRLGIGIKKVMVVPGLGRIIIPVSLDTRSVLPTTGAMRWCDVGWRLGGKKTNYSYRECWITGFPS